MEFELYAAFAQFTCLEIHFENTEANSLRRWGLSGHRGPVSDSPDYIIRFPVRPRRGWFDLSTTKSLPCRAGDFAILEQVTD
jgi:hypothetical protein